MVEIKPFRGLRYAPHIARQSVFSPPYDVINTQLRQQLLAASPYNVVHVTLGPQNPNAEWYATAAQRFEDWKAEGILVRDSDPAFYAYEQVFKGPSEQRLVRRGFFARVRLAPWGQGIYPHEKTRSGPKADRLRLMKALCTQESSVFGLYRDPEGILDALWEPAPADAISATDEDGVRHTIWPLSDPKLVEQLQAFFHDKHIVIADGHHRYETALAYRDAMRSQHPSETVAPAHDYVLMYLTPVERAGMIILPTHRLITTALPLGDERLCAALESDFALHPIAPDDHLAAAVAEQRHTEIVLGMRLRSGAWTLTLRDRQRAHAAAPANQPEELAELDVCVLQNLVLAPHLCISAQDLAHGDVIEYTIDADQACRAVREQRASAAFVLGPTDVDQVWQTAIAKVTMPQKSTYFYPKLLTGLVMNPLTD